MENYKEINTGTTNREVVSSFMHLLQDKGPLSDEGVVSKREVYFMLIRYRARILAEKQRARGFTLSRHNLQTIACIPVDEVDQAECPCAPASGCTFLKTKFKIPKPIGNLQSVTSIDGRIAYDYIQWERYQDLTHSRFEAEANSASYTLRNIGGGTYLYLYNDTHKESITVTGVFESPLEIQNYPDCSTHTTDCCFSPLDEEFIIDPDLLPIIYDLALGQFFRAKTPQQDIFNNDQDDLTQTPIPLK